MDEDVNVDEKSKVDKNVKIDDKIKIDENVKIDEPVNFYKTSNKVYYSNDRNHTRTNIFTPFARMTFLMRLWFMGMASRWRHTG